MSRQQLLIEPDYIAAYGGPMIPDRDLASIGPMSRNLNSHLNRATQLNEQPLNLPAAFLTLPPTQGAYAPIRREDTAAAAAAKKAK